MQKGIEVGQCNNNEKSSLPNNVEPKKTFRSALPQILATSAKNILLLGYGMTLGFPTIVIPSLQPHHGNVTDLREKDTLSLTEEQISWFSSINLICVPLGCLMSGTLTQPLGRKRAMILVNVPFIVAWVMFHYASNVGMLYASLVLTGLGGGLLEAPVLTYVAEITQPHLRGMLSATSSMCVILGVFIQFLMGTMLSWRTVASINVMFPVTAVVALCFVPESPYWLIGRGRVADAEKSLCWLRGWVKPHEVQPELLQLVSSLKSHSPSNRHNVTSVSFTPSCSSWRNYTKRNFLQPYSLVAAGFFFGHFGGMTTLQTYAVSIFAQLGTPVDKYIATLYLGLVQLGGALICVILVHWTGKRPLTCVSTVGSGVCFIVVATYAYLYSSRNSYEWLPMTFLIGSAFLSHVGIRLLPWILIGEVYPSEIRGVASGASGSIGYIFGFAANKVYFYMLNSMTLPGTFWCYGAVSLVGSVFFHFFLPETEGRTLLEIQEHFEGSRNLLKKGRVSSKDPEKLGTVNPALVPDETHL
ncbi:facilitated trehalose transporter Tret1 isoform X4 [Cryptotermes secundus]|uniref:facilitated trehalose transporter Tret1 isoform X4 n=1 Tax=Cryptotermes secundus TaxID=105785 RepID=UPI000CD7D0D2|nr:facilitated trehalose transporter Tret1 isoform X4 [Cryptotermes secundus]